MASDLDPFKEEILEKIKNHMETHKNFKIKEIEEIVIRTLNGKMDYTAISRIVGGSVRRLFNFRTRIGLEKDYSSICPELVEKAHKERIQKDPKDYLHTYAMGVSRISSLPEARAFIRKNGELIQACDDGELKKRISELLFNERSQFVREAYEEIIEDLEEMNA